MPLEKSYDAKKRANEIYDMWENNGFFSANPFSEKPSYCIVMPPPNVTGVLHMGHALVSTLQDILIRWKRMQGYETLWVPGIDHAGIATQTVVERHLIKTKGKRRKDFTRDEFLKHVWDWKADKETVILEQLRGLGCSCDWKRYRFTMDDSANRAVKRVFKMMFDDGLIYRGNYLVNWDPVTQTALADDEVEYIERNTSLWHIRYQLTDASGHLVIATTRPETMLGDTAVAINPKDQRYQHLIGKTILLPIVQREIPIIGDPFVNMEFGTGVVKVTPAHDPNDYQIAHRHNLPMINIMTPDGRILDGEFAGLSMEDARGAIAEKLKELGFLEKTEPYTHRVGVSYRSKAPIEPYISKQWFVKMDGFKEKLRRAVEEGAVKIIPNNWSHTYFHWIDHLRDWCISRQLWWGHRIPIWYHKDDPEQMLCYDGDGLPPEVEAQPDQWVQDPDALDTWFSSGLWPFSTLGWPEQTPELAKFYPNSVLVTGHDILFFWVARMMVMGLYTQNQVPFPDTFIHGLVYGRSYWRLDENGGVDYVQGQERVAYDRGQPMPKDVHSRWEKLSKSKGNVIDPKELIDEYGLDAMRMALCASGPQNLQIDLDRRRMEEFRNFTNKIWNGARFVLMNLEGNIEFGSGLDQDSLQLEDRWILSVLGRTVSAVNHHLEKYAFDHAATTAYDFFWKEFCAYYVEAVKPALFGKVGDPKQCSNKQKILAIVLGSAIRLLHPMAPIITEELFGHLKERLAGHTVAQDADHHTQELFNAISAKACIVAPFPAPTAGDAEVEADFAQMQELIYTIRNIRGEMKLPLNLATDVYLVGSINPAHLHLIPALVRIQRLEICTQEPNLPFASTGVVGNLKILIPLPPEQRKQEADRLTKELQRLQAQIEGIQGRLDNNSFVAKAPPELVKKTRADLVRACTERAEVQDRLTQLVN